MLSPNTSWGQFRLIIILGSLPIGSLHTDTDLELRGFIWLHTTLPQCKGKFLNMFYSLVCEIAVLCAFAFPTDLMTPYIIRLHLSWASALNWQKLTLLLLVNTSQLFVLKQAWISSLELHTFLVWTLVLFPLTCIFAAYSTGCIYAFPRQKDLLAITISGELTPSVFHSKWDFCYWDCLKGKNWLEVFNLFLFKNKCTLFSFSFAR